jgi:type II secretory pathway component HofQ
MRLTRSVVLTALLLSTSALAGPLVKRITLDVQQADVHSLLRMFAEVSRLNFIVGEEVKGSVTLSLRNVRWEDALDAVLAARGLGMERRANIIRVAPLQQLAEEAETRARTAKSKLLAGPLETRFIPVNYAQASDLVPHVKAMLSERGSVTVDVRTNTLIVTDVAP